MPPEALDAFHRSWLAMDDFHWIESDGGRFEIRQKRWSSRFALPQVGWRGGPDVGGSWIVLRGSDGLELVRYDWEEPAQPSRVPTRVFVQPDRDALRVWWRADARMTDGIWVQPSTAWSGPVRLVRAP